VDKPRKENISKIYCEKCDSIFNSKTKYEKHLETHSSGAYCESCQLDTAVQKIAKLSKRFT